MEKDQLLVIIHIIDDPLDSVKYSSALESHLKIPSIQIDNHSDQELMSMITRSESEQSYLFKVHVNSDVAKLTTIFGHIARKKCRVFVQGESEYLEQSLKKFRIVYTKVDSPDDLLF